MSYKIKYRSIHHDGIKDGFYIYSHKLYPFKNKAYGGKRRRLIGPFKTRISARAQARLMALKLVEFKTKLK